MVLAIHSLKPVEWENCMNMRSPFLELLDSGEMQVHGNSNGKMIAHYWRKSSLSRGFLCSLNKNLPKSTFCSSKNSSKLLIKLNHAESSCYDRKTITNKKRISCCLRESCANCDRCVNCDRDCDVVIYGSSRHRRTQFWLKSKYIQV